ncbi:WD repeat-containing and planar cell polarity effector protein fritz -like protein [Halotydeus destructor]|nr:WD repeat-containing and planar cell polarity effector protein fritz -like protein [Halotydeus destructor]
MFRLKSTKLTDVNNLSAGRKSKKTESRLLQLNDLLRLDTVRIVLLKWMSRTNALVIVFNTGLVCWVFFDSSSQKPNHIYFDKFLVGKFVSSHVVDIVWREDEAIFISYAEPKITGIFFGNVNGHKSEKNSFKLKNASLKLTEIDLHVSNITRRAPRRLEITANSTSTPMFLTWWQSSPSTVAPWTAPVRSEKDLANLLIYTFDHSQVDLLGYASVPCEIKKVSFCRARSNQVLIAALDESSSSLKFVVLELRGEDEAMVTIFSLKVSLIARCIQVDFTAAQDKLLILCENRTVMLFCLEENAVYTLRTSIDGTKILCSPLDAFFVVCDKFGQVLMYDYALSVIPSNYDDLSLRWQLDVIDVVNQINFINSDFITMLSDIQSDQGAISLISFPPSMSLTGLITEYLKYDYVNEAISNLLTINWNTDSYLAYSSLNLIFNFLLRLPLNPLRESQIENTLGVYFKPVRPAEAQVYEEYRLSMHFLAKRFFYHLVRYNSVEKAFLLALDLKSRHLFLLLHKIAIEKGDEKLMEVAFERAADCESCDSDVKFACRIPLEASHSSIHNSTSQSTRHQIPIPAPRKSLTHNQISAPSEPPPPLIERSCKPEQARLSAARMSVQYTVDTASEPLNCHQLSGDHFTSPPPPLPPKRPVKSTGPPLPPKSFLLNNNSRSVPVEPFQSTSDKHVLRLDVSHEPVDLGSLPTPSLSSSSSLDAQLSPTSSLSSENSDEVPLQLNRDKPKIECISFGVV